MTETSERQRLCEAVTIGPIDPAVYYGVEAYGALFHKSVRAVHNDRYGKVDMPVATKIGGRLFWLGQDILDWLETQREAPREAG